MEAEEDDFFGEQDGGGDSSLGVRDLEEVERRHREAGFREELPGLREKAMQIGFERGFGEGLQMSDQAGFWLGVVSSLLVFAEKGRIRLDESIRGELGNCRRVLLRFIKDGDASCSCPDQDDCELNEAIGATLTACRALGSKFGIHYHKETSDAAASTDTSKHQRTEEAA